MQGVHIIYEFDKDRPNRFGILLLKMYTRYVQDELTSFDGDTDGPVEGE